MAKLYEIVGELQDFINTNEGLEDEQAYKDTLEALQGELDDKVSQWARCIKNMEAEKTAVKEEADRLAKRAKTIDSQITHMKDTLLMFLKAAGRDKAGDAVIKASIAKNGGKAPLIVDYINAEDLPQEFQKVTVTANNDAIRDALEHGIELDWARIGERGEHINIK